MMQKLKLNNDPLYSMYLCVTLYHMWHCVELNVAFLFTDFIIRFGVMALKALIASTFLKILPTKRKVRVFIALVPHTSDMMPPCCVAAGQVLHAVGVCFADVPVADTSSTVVQILVKLLSNRAIVCSFHHCYLPHDQGGWGSD